jgi:hypothetical protein
MQHLCSRFQTLARSWGIFIGKSISKSMALTSEGAPLDKASGSGITRRAQHPRAVEVQRAHGRLRAQLPAEPDRAVLAAALPPLGPALPAGKLRPALRVPSVLRAAGTPTPAPSEPCPRRRRRASAAGAHLRMNSPCDFLWLSSQKSLPFVGRSPSRFPAHHQSPRPTSTCVRPISFVASNFPGNQGDY